MRFFPPKARHLVPRGSEEELYRLLLSRGMIVLVPEDQVPRGADGSPLVGGLFCVAHKAEVDRLINDRRPLNAVEGRLFWAQLPHGCLLSSLCTATRLF